MQWYIKKFGSLRHATLMEFNFYDQYKSYSSFELLKILQQPADYQAAAVEGAALILKERGVPEQDQTHAATHMEAIQQKEQVKKEKITAVKGKVFDFLESLVRPGNEFHPIKWLNILLIVTAVQYLIYLFDKITRGDFFPLANYTNGGLLYYILAFVDI